MSLAGWLPIRAFWDGRRVMLDWCHAGERRLAEPFFDHTVERCLERPFNQLFRRQTPVEALLETAADLPRPNGLLFHLSRCGSTLVAQQLAAAGVVVVSEPSVADGLLRAWAADPHRREEDLVGWLGALLTTLCRPRGGDGPAAVVKLEPWHTVHLPLFRHALPETPWAFLFRDPVEVLVSLAREPGGRLVPGAIPPALLDLEPVEVFTLEPAVYHARVLHRICAAALADDGGRFVAYHQLPVATWTVLAPLWSIPVDDGIIASMRARARERGKQPGLAFTADGEAKRRAATAAVRAAAERWLRPTHHELETRATGGVPE